MRGRGGVPAPDLTPRIDELSSRVDEVAAAIPGGETDALAARIESLEEEGRAGNGALERLAAELGELRSRTRSASTSLAAREPDLAPVDELRVRVEELAAVVGRGPDPALLDGLWARLDELAAVVERESDAAPVDEVRARVEELAAVAGGARIRRCSTGCGRVWTSWRLWSSRESMPRRSTRSRLRLDELAVAVQREPDLAPGESSFGSGLRISRRRSGGARIRRCWTGCGRGWTSWRLWSSGSRMRRRWTRCAPGWMSWRWRCSGSRIWRRLMSCGCGWRSWRRRSAGPGCGVAGRVGAARLDELAAAVERESDAASLDRGARPVGRACGCGRAGPRFEVADGLRVRLDELAVAVQREPDLAPVDELRVRVEELAAAVGGARMRRCWTGAGAGGRVCGCGRAVVGRGLARRGPRPVWKSLRLRSSGTSRSARSSHVSIRSSVGSLQRLRPRSFERRSSASSRTDRRA